MCPALPTLVGVDRLRRSWKSWMVAALVWVMVAAPAVAVAGTGTGFVNAAPVVTTHPQDQSVLSAATATFTAAARGTPTPAVQWQVSTDGGITFQNLSGATATTYSFSPANSDDGDLYRAVFTNSEGSNASAAATLRIIKAPSVYTHPAHATVIPGAQVSFSSYADGYPYPAVRWQVSTPSADSGTGFVNIPGATSQTYTFSADPADTGKQYRAVFTSTLGTATSNAATLTVGGAPSVTTSASGIGVGRYHTCAVTLAGGVACWGYNYYGQLGNGSTVDSNIPVMVSGLTSGIAGVAAGAYHTCALTTGGGVKCWGSNSSGQLGNGSTTNAMTPTDVTGLTSGVRAIDGGLYHTCAVTNGGGVKCWGHNNYGQLGNGTTASVTTPVDVIGLTSGVAGLGVGTYHSCAVTTGGGVKCWGYNNYGQLGNGSTTSITTPANVSGLTSSAGSVSGGHYHTCAVTVAGGVACWGYNSYGQLGNGTTTNATIPVDVSGLTGGVSGVGLGGYHSCAVTTGGGVKCWGQNWDGQLGTGSSSSSALTPADASGLTSGVRAIDGGQYHTCALTNGGAVKCWGYNSYGQLGVGSKSAVNSPVSVLGLTGLAPSITRQPATQTVQAGSTATFVAGAVGTPAPSVQWQVAASGSGSSFVDIGGATGTTHAFVVASADSGRQFRAVFTSAGNSTTTLAAVLTVATVPSVFTHPESQTVLPGGTASFTASGSGTPAPTVQWQQSTNGGTSFADIAGAIQTTYSPTGSAADPFLTADASGTKYRAVFTNVAGTATTNAATLTIGSAPTQSMGATAIGAGLYHSCAVTSVGGLRCWGYNNYGQLGNGSLTSSLVPVDVSGLTGGAASVAGGAYHTCALTTGGGVKCWGNNGSGQLGDGSSVVSRTPVDVTGLSTGVSSITAGYYHTCALTTGGGVKCWGQNSSGQLGNGSTANALTPADVSGLTSGVLAIGAGYYHTCAVTSGGGVKCWGRNSDSQLGNGSTATSVTTPVDVSGLPSGARAVALGYSHTCAVTTGGRVKCWGYNGQGQIGNGSTTNATTPADVSGLTSGVLAIGAGHYHTCAVTTGGGVKCWGYNYYGQLGVGNTTTSRTPVDMIGLETAADAVALSGAGTLTGNTSVAGGGYHTCVISGRGAVRCVGRNNYGQLGNGSTAQSALPVGTAGISGVVGDVSASPARLRFGATKAGAAGALLSVTVAQSVSVAFAGSVSTWTASTADAWLQVTDGAGTGAGSFTVGITNPGNVIGGSTSLTGTITVAAVNAPNSPVTVPVTLTVDQTGSATMPPFGMVDTPGQNTTGVVGSIGVTGWALDDVGIASVKLYRQWLSDFEPAVNYSPAARGLDWNGVHLVYMGDADVVPGARPDVELAYPTHPQAYRAGWGYLLLTNMLPHIPNKLMYGGEGTVSIYVMATDIEGHVTLLGRGNVSDATPTALTMANDTAVKPFGAIDTPGQGQTVSGGLWNFGWALTPDLDTVAGAGDILIPTTGSSIWVWIDGLPLPLTNFNLCRGSVGSPVPSGLYCDDDVANIFGNPTPQMTFTPRSANATKYRNLDVARGAMGAYYLDTTALSNGRHSIVWGVTDSEGRVDGVGSRDFIVLNSGADAGVRVAERSADAPAEARGDASWLITRATAGGQVQGRTGFDLGAPVEDLSPDAAGVRHVRLVPQSRVELWLGTVDGGYLVANGALRDLPPGSRLDPVSGLFTWTPGVAYFGTYRLVFMRGGEQIAVDVTIRPAEAPASGDSVVRMHVDAPVDGETRSAPVTVAGWALDPQASIGTGIDAVHVWAQRRGVPASGAQFLGAATLDLARPDVATAYGPQFVSAGFSLATNTLDPGHYDITVYVWNRRTARWEDARTVPVVVR